MKIAHDDPPANRLAAWFHLGIAIAAVFELTWHVWAAWEHWQAAKPPVNPYYGPEE